MNLLPPFPEVFDSSMRSAFVACPRQWYYGYLLSLRKSTTSVHLHFGGCMAHALEVTRKAYWLDQLDEINAVSKGLHAFIRMWGDFEPDDAIMSSRGGVKTLDAGLDAVLSYFEMFPLGSDAIKPLMIGSEPMVEKSFALPIPGTRHPTTGEPIVYAGRFDMIGRYDDAIFVVDEKTTTSLGSTWRSNWILRGQLTGYCWGCRSFGLDAAGCVIRGIGILKGSIQFEQAIVTRPAWLVDRWLGQLTRDVNRATAMWEQAAELDASHEAFDQSFDSACTSFGGCGYTSLCDSEDPRRWYSDFQVVHWDPLQRIGDIP